MSCSRCGTEDSMFWYPYAFGLAPTTNYRPARCEYFTLCDRCQAQFVRFMKAPTIYQRMSKEDE